VQAAPVRTRLDLLAATEPIRNDQSILGRFTNFREEDTFSAFHRDVVVPVLEPKCARHSATTGIRHLVVQPKLSKHLLLGIHFHQRFVMAMSVDKSRGVEPRRSKIGGLLFEELTQQECLLAEALGKRVGAEG